jgi:uncharacterized membrane protein YeiH
MPFLLDRSLFIEVIGYLGIMSASVSAVTLGLKKGMDPIGLIVLAFVTSFGGGTLRDLLIGNTPVFILSNPRFIFAVLSICILMFFIGKFIVKFGKVLEMFDAVALGLFAIFGANKGLEFGIHPVGCVALAAITGAGGGIIRDIICREIPLVFQREIYIFPCVIGSIIYIIWIKWFNGDKEMVGTFCSLFIIIVRILAIKYNYRIKLPQSLDPGIHQRDSKKLE